MRFEKLIQNIQDTSYHLRQNAVKAINIQLTVRNWLVGYFIMTFEQKGEDRAVYGSKLMQELAAKIQIKGLTAPELSRCRQFYNTYPEIFKTIAVKLNHLIPLEILGSLTQESDSILGSLTQELQETENETNEDKYFQLLTRISFTHFIELIKIENHTKNFLQSNKIHDLIPQNN